MLLELFVKNFALIDEVRMEFGPGFSVISGETGAGKSILVEALGLLIGGKATPALVRTGEAEAVVEGIFEIGERVGAIHPPSPSGLRRTGELPLLLAEAGLDDDGRLAIRRHISAEGRNKIYVNGRSATLLQLEAIGPYLVDLSGQHDQQLLLHEENHRAILDLNPEISSLLEVYYRYYKSYAVLENEFKALKQQSANRDQRLDFLKFQLKEITDANIGDEAEEEKLLAEKSRVKNADFLFGLAGEVSGAVSEGTMSQGEGAILERLDGLISRIEKGLDRDPSLGEGLKMLSEVRAPLSDAGDFFRSYLEKLSVEPGRLDEIEARLYLFHQLKKKYGETLARVKEKGEEIKRSLDELENFEERLGEKENALARLGADMLDSAKALSHARKTAAVTLEKKIQKELAELSMPGVLFLIHVNSPDKPTSSDCKNNGFDEVRFDFTPNKGEAPRALAKIASGGELSRILLAIKQVLGSRPQGGSPSESMTYIFDEVDTGIGGAVAFVVGQKLKNMARTNQVLCVTHLPQVASHADRHYVIVKEVKNRRTFTGARVLERQEREEEIARMLGGLAVTAKTKEHAREMLRTAGS